MEEFRVVETLPAALLKGRVVKVRISGQRQVYDEVSGGRVRGWDRVQLICTESRPGFAPGVSHERRVPRWIDPTTLPERLEEIPELEGALE